MGFNSGFKGLKWRFA